jgi:hypothetical protein
VINVFAAAILVSALSAASHQPFTPTTTIESPSLIATPPRQRLTSNGSIETAPQSTLHHSSSFISGALPIEI